MLAQSVYTLINQQNGNLVFKLFEFDNTCYFDHIQCHNHFNLILIISGEGTSTVYLYNYKSPMNLVTRMNIILVDYLRIKLMFRPRFIGIQLASNEQYPPN